MKLQFSKGCGGGNPPTIPKEKNGKKQGKVLGKRKREDAMEKKKVFLKPCKQGGPSVSPSPPPPVAEEIPVVIGTSAAIEKAYRRGEGNVVPENVRPLDVLEKAFELILERQKNPGTNGYVYTKDQLKSIRQDLLVQNIRTHFTWGVYMFSFNEALAQKDLDEVSQCLSQLKNLHDADGVSESEKMEVLGYVIVFACLRGDYMAAQREISKLDKVENPSVAHAIGIVNALGASNYALLKKLILKSPKKFAQITRLFLPTLREAILLKILTAYLTLTPTDIASILFLPSPQSAIALLKSYGVTFSDDESPDSVITCKTVLNEVSKTLSDKINPQFEDLKGRVGVSISPVPSRGL